MRYFPLNSIFIILFLHFSNSFKESGEELKIAGSNQNEGQSKNISKSTDGKCGDNNGKICPGNECCSTYGFCGISDEHCITYCDPNYSVCKSSTTSTVSTNGRCGVYNSNICPEGQCCSIFGYCGVGDDFCITNCDSKYSNCSFTITYDGRCGISNGKKCPKGQCCSTYGYCGNDTDYCIKYCDPNYNECKHEDYKITSDKRCGVENGKLCKNEDECCSIHGYCGSSDDHCINLCDPNYSKCKPEKLEYTTDGYCGKMNNKKCKDGLCCNIDGKCGNSTEHCITNCVPKYGKCNYEYDRCGLYNGKICPEGQCCSTFGYCGESEDHCITYCDPKYGECHSYDSLISTDTHCGKTNGKRCPTNQCCNIEGFCGESDDDCTTHCDPYYGFCRPEIKCGANNNNKRCPKGQCCSKTSWNCGTDEEHCITSCDRNYGECYNNNNTEVSTDGKCGKKNYKRCPEGLCCSNYGYCGNEEAHCITECDPRYGMCKNQTQETITK